MRDAAEAAATLVRQVEAHKALTAEGETPQETSAGEDGAAATAQTSNAPQAAGARKRGRSKKKKTLTEPAPPT
jgi:hypothetical protein